MHIIKYGFDYLNGTPDFFLTDGVLINDIESVTWVERYREPGYFVFKSERGLGLERDFSIGDVVTHTNTQDVMIVESIIIKEDQSKSKQTVEVKGRSIDCLLDQRVVGSIEARSGNDAKIKYTLAANKTVEQAKTLVENHAVNPSHAADAFAGLVTSTDGSGSSVGALDLGPGSVLSALDGILASEDKGVKILRPSSNNANTSATYMHFHGGVDLSSEVSFYHSMGDISTASYLNTLKANYTSVLVKGTWVSIVVDDGVYSNTNRRVGYVNASYVDENYDDQPTAGQITTITNELTEVGDRFLASQNLMELANVELDQEKVDFRYREDYDIGDIVSVYGAFSDVNTMRVVEHAEIYDKQSWAAYPTLSLIT